MELEQHGLRGLTREPELATRRVVAEALGRHGGDLGVEKRGERYHGHLAHELLRRTPGQDRQAPQAGGTGALEEREPYDRVVRQHRRRTRAQRSRDGAFRPRLDVERREGEPRAALCQGASCGRKTFLLGERLLQRTRPLARELHPLGEAIALLLRARAPLPLP